LLGHIRSQYRCFFQGSPAPVDARPGHAWRRVANALGYSVLVLLEHGAWFAGSVMLAEKIFAIPGLGDLGVEAFVRRDYPKIQAFLVVIVGAYAVIRAVVSGIEAALEARVARQASSLPLESPQKSAQGIGSLIAQDGFFLGAVLVGAFAATTVFAAHVAPFLPDEVHMKDRLLPPTTQYWMGADLLGRDMLSRVIHGGRYALMVAAAGATGALLLGFVLGGLPRLAGRIGVTSATVLIRMLEAFPALIVGLLMMTLLGQGYRHEVAALTAALAAQRALKTSEVSKTSEVWPLRVRMGLHTGAAEERDGDYFGPTLNRVARMFSAGHGGQTLLSLATYELVRDHLPPGAGLHDLGDHRLKDLTRPEHVFQLVVPDLPADFPPLKTLDTHPNNLPIQATPFIGREREVEAVRRLLTPTPGPSPSPNGRGGGVA